jgi:hypothetical protein
MKPEYWLLIAAGVGGGIILYIHQKDKANAATSSDVQGSSPSTVLPNTSTTATPTADSTWNPAYRIANQQATVNQAMS